MTDKQLLEEKYRAQLAEWRADIDKLKARAAQAGGRRSRRKGGK